MEEIQTSPEQSTPNPIEIEHNGKPVTLRRVTTSDWAKWKITNPPNETDWKSWGLLGTPYISNKSDTTPTIAIHIESDGTLRKVPTHKAIEETGTVKRYGADERVVELPVALDFKSHGEPCGKLSQRYGGKHYSSPKVINRS